MRCFAEATVIAGRLLLAQLFIVGAVQKVMAPEAAAGLLAGIGLPSALIWPAMILNAMGAVCLIFGLWLAPTALILAAYCMVTSPFHYIPEDPWQMSIFVKNWAIAGGLLVLFAHEALHPKG